MCDCILHLVVLLDIYIKPNLSNGIPKFSCSPTRRVINSINFMQRETRKSIASAVSQGYLLMTAFTVK